MSLSTINHFITTPLYAQAYANLRNFHNQTSLNTINNNYFGNFLLNTYKSNQSHFKYFDSKNLGIVSDDDLHYELIDISSNEICNYEQTTIPSKVDQYFYYSGNIMQDNFNLIVNELSFINELIINKEVLFKTIATIWISGKTVTSNAHYDSVYNVYTQITGVKKFILMPPTSITKVTILPTKEEHYNKADSSKVIFRNNLQLHGRQSPYSRQSRIQKLDSYARDDLSSQRSWYNENAIEIILHPGDVLVIPPFWIHEVEALDCSLSLSLWWDCKELDIMDEIYLLSLPFESTWSAATTLSAVELLASYLLKNTVSNVHRVLSDYKHTAISSSSSSNNNKSQSIRQMDFNSYQRWVHEKLFSNFNTIQLLELLRVRYIEIWDFIENDYRRNTPNPPPDNYSKPNQSSNANYCSSCSYHYLLPSGCDCSIFTATPVTNNPSLTNEVIKESSLQSNASFMKALYKSVNQRSDIFSNKFILYQANNKIQFNVANENIIEILGDTFFNVSKKLSNSPNFFTSIQNSLEFYFENRLAILSIKICDYIEDLFLYPLNSSSSESYHLYTNKTTGKIIKVRNSIITLLRWVRHELILQSSTQHKNNNSSLVD